MSDPCDLTIRRQTADGGLEFMRIEARDGPKVLARIDFSMGDFARALTGQEVGAGFSMLKDAQ